MEPGLIEVTGPGSVTGFARAAIVAFCPPPQFRVFRPGPPNGGSTDGRNGCGPGSPQEPRDSPLRHHTVAAGPGQEPGRTGVPPGRRGSARFDRARPRTPPRV